MANRWPIMPVAAHRGKLAELVRRGAAPCRCPVCRRPALNNRPCSTACKNEANQPTGRKAKETVA